MFEGYIQTIRCELMQGETETNSGSRRTQGTSENRLRSWSKGEPSEIEEWPLFRAKTSSRLLAPTKL